MLGPCEVEALGIGSYKYVALEMEDGVTTVYRCYGAGRSVSICEKMANDGANFVRLCDDLVNFVKSLPEHPHGYSTNV